MNTSTIFRARAEGELRRVLGMVHRNKVLPGEGGYLMFDATIPPGSGSPLHVHEVDTECFYLLAGELTFLDESGERVARAGDTCLLPAGRAHGFVNRGADSVRAIVIASPGESARQFFDDMDALADRLTPATVVEVAARHGLSVCPAPG